ncbi:LOW QUALITY PROTEIN: serine/threonine-protein kinase RUNKEL [Selaginella moellendorffii]|uniref:LOW QUALITY PROTEIN: serine/threonine-protein kinase RUNKEL n=1 Tax=Selaginella moellendorffii TaxID=88036 RepID=UPI000D1CF17F|nr:LOW QUALITY PROTEIN: serine/threonine-protein kinase RUNKEL [Selaginella moellendorffii]|eukprot:XP_024534759.1 LOW QUALITY PROTEIN: serine/threonine-protein kinase RUNKEL [Selaginella moellendorffii]
MNQYHIYEAIGRGKHSTVYKGRKKKSIEYYAIKSVEKSQKNKVLQEVRTLHSLDHPNVLKFYAWYETSAHLWLVLEYCVGGDLLTLLKQDTRLPEESVHDFARDLVEALQFLHSKGIVYCDLKPSNLLLDENGRIKLCDFGLARRLADISKNTVQQLPQAKRGTPCYMAPELFQGGVHSFSSDLWALGCVMYECYAGKPPFVSTSFTQLVESILHDPAPALSASTNKDFEDLLSRLLVKDPAERMKWSELRDHSFWRKKIKPLVLPSQPAVLKYLDSKKTSEPQDITEKSRNGGSGPKQQPATIKKHEYLHKTADKGETIANGKTPPGRRPASSGPLTEASGRANAVVNVLRLSKIVKTNLQREAEGDSYRQQNAGAATNDSDLTLENHDQELDFAERPDTDGETEDDESVSAAEATTHDESVHEDGADSNGKELDYDKNVEEVRLEALRMEVAATPPGAGIPRKAQRIAALTGEKKKPAVSKAEDHPKASITLSQALWHPSDLAVRPIMQNRKADQAADVRFDGKTLPVDSLSSSEFLKLQPDELEAFVTRIMNSICGNTSVNEKMNTLKYLETICVSMDAANVFINGVLMHSLVKLLRTTKLPALRVQLTSVIGLLVRHATLIEDDLASSGIIAVLTETLRDKQEKVRRCAMASLGELLFYIATQNGGSPRSGAGHDNVPKEGRSSVWQVPSTTIALVASILRKGEDDVTQHYALKAIENISSQGGEWAARFTTHDVLGNLCYIMKTSSKQEVVRSTAGSCLVRLVRFSPSSVAVVLEKVTFKELIAGLCKGGAKLQQVYINLLNIALVGSSVMNNASRHLQVLFDEKALIPNIMAILEQGPEVLRGKAFVCAALLCKINRRWMLSFCNAKIVPAVERLTKEKDAYVQQCVDALIQIVVSLVPGILDSIGADFQQSANSKRPSSATTTQHATLGRSQPRGSMPLFPVVLHLFRSMTFRDRIVNSQVLQQLATFLKRMEAATSQGQDDFQTTLLRIIESISQQPSILLAHQEIFITQVLPSLANLYRRNTCGDTRFLCLKVFCDILLVIMDDMAEQSSGTRQDQMRLIIKQYFLPLYPVLLDDEDPIPMYAQKLLVMLLDLRCIDINDILQLKIVSQFFEFLKEDLATVNLHNVRLCLFLVSSQEVETAVISELHVVSRLVALLEFVHLKGMQDFLDPTLSVCRLLLIRNAGKLKSSGSSATNNGFKVEELPSQLEDVGGFSARAGLFVDLCGNPEPRIAETASECLILAVKAAPGLAAPSVLSSLQELAKVLERSTSGGHGSALLSLLQRRLLQALTLACKEQRLGDSSGRRSASAWPAAAVTSLENVVLRLRKSSLPQVADAAVDAALELQILPGRS